MRAELTELVEMYASGDRGKKISFGHRIKKLSEEDQTAVWEALEKKGIKSPDALQAEQREKRQKNQRRIADLDSRQNETKIRWTDEEWDQLADVVWRARLKDPGPHIVQLVQRAVSQFPKARQRKVTTLMQVQPLMGRLEAKRQEIEDIKDRKEKLENKLQHVEEAPSREEVLDNITDEEVEVYFKERVFDLTTPQEMISRLDKDDILEMLPLPVVAGYAIQELLSNWADNSNETQRLIRQLSFNQPKGSGKPIPSQPTQTTRKPKVMILGCLGDQQRIIEDRINGQANLRFVDKNRGAGIDPSGSDIVVMWANYISHAHQDQIRSRVGSSTRIIVHHGGIKRLVDKVEEAISINA